MPIIIVKANFCCNCVYCCCYGLNLIRTKVEDVCGEGSLHLTEKDATTPRKLHKVTFSVYPFYNLIFVFCHLTGTLEQPQLEKEITASQRGSLTWDGEVNVNSIAIPPLEGGGVVDDAVVSECITHVEGLRATYCEVVRLGLKLAATCSSGGNV